MDNPLFNKHVQTIYDSVLEDAGWEMLITQLVQDLDFRSGTIGVDSQEEGIITRFSFGYDNQELSLIKDYYHKLDIWTQALWSQPMQEFHPSEKMIPDSEFKKTEFYNDFCKPVDIAHTTGCFIQSDHTHGLRIAFQRTHEQGSCIEHIGYLNALSPHLNQAAKLRQQFKDYEVRLQSVTAIIDTMPIATLLVDENARIHYANANAEQLFLSHSTLQNKQGVLELKNAFRNTFIEILQQTVKAAAGQYEADQNEVTINYSGQKTMVLPATNEHSELEIQVQPIGVYESMFGMHIRKPLALVYIKEINPQSPLNRDILQSFFNLSSREIELASKLVQGKSLNDIVTENHRSMNTLKTQLKSLFAKTGTNSQSQLVARLLSSLAAAKNN